MPSELQLFCCVCGEEPQAHGPEVWPILFDNRQSHCYEFRQHGDDVQSWLYQQPGVTTLGMKRELLPALVKAGIPLTAPAHRWESDVRRVLAGMLGEGG